MKKRNGKRSCDEFAKNSKELQSQSNRDSELQLPQQPEESAVEVLV
jgi:hypothetical protein